MKQRSDVALCCSLTGAEKPSSIFVPRCPLGKETLSTPITSPLTEDLVWSSGYSSPNARCRPSYCRAREILLGVRPPRGVLSPSRPQGNNKRTPCAYHASL